MPHGSEGVFSRRPSRHPLHGRNDMQTSKKRFSRHKHAHKQRKKGLSCHHAQPLYIRTFQPLQPARSGPVPRMRHGQTPSGTLRYSLKRSASILVQPSSSAMTVTTASRATYTLHCFNGLQQPKRPSRPHRPHRPKEPQRPQGWMLSFDSHHPIPQLSVNNLFFVATSLAICMHDKKTVHGNMHGHDVYSKLSYERAFLVSSKTWAGVRSLLVLTSLIRPFAL